MTTRSLSHESSHSFFPVAFAHHALLRGNAPPPRPTAQMRSRLGDGRVPISALGLVRARVQCESQVATARWKRKSHAEVALSESIIITGAIITA